MNKTSTIVAVIAALIIIAGVVYVISRGNAGSYAASTTTIVTASPTTTSPTTNFTSTAYTVKLENSTTFGTYLANASGFTLYTYSGDTQNSGTSSCTGECASIWPPFYTSSLVLPPGLNASSFTTITRSDGSKQLAYNGWPLYLYTGDSYPGQVNGNNVAGFKVAIK